MPDASRPVPRPTKIGALTDRLDGLARDVQAVRDGHAGIAARFDHLDEGIAHLRLHVIDGNGSPGLIQRVSALETHRHNDKNAAQTIMLQVGELRDRIDKFLDEAARRREEDAKELHRREVEDRRRADEAAAARRTGRNGVILSVLTAVAAGIGYVVQAVLPLVWK